MDEGACVAAVAAGRMEEGLRMTAAVVAVAAVPAVEEEEGVGASYYLCQT